MILIPFFYRVLTAFFPHCYLYGRHRPSAIMKKLAASIVSALALLGGGAVQAQGVAPASAAVAPVAPATPVAPVDPAAARAVRELFVLMKYQTVMGNAMKQMAQNLPVMMRNSLEAQINNNPDLSREDKQVAIVKAEAKLPAVAAAMQSFFNDPKLIEEIIDETVPLYARAFSVAEIGQLADFYRSPIGAKMLAVTPQLMGEGMQIGQRVVARRIGPLMQQLQQAAAEGAAGATSAPQPAPAAAPERK